MVNDPSAISGEEVADCVDRFRVASPHVHCITNSVAQHFTANVLLAAGATPSMTIAVEEVSDFVTMADALLINLGTMDADRTVAIDRATTAAQSANKPWAVDPVFVQASPLRLQIAKKLLGQNPSLVRCNAPEFKSLFDTDPDQIGAVVEKTSTTIALTGKNDVICNNSGRAVVSNGSAVMDRITAMGCALTALAIGFMSVEQNHRLATTSALAFFALSGEQAEQRSAGPGTFVPHFLDALSSLSASTIEKGVRLS
jgi:hydroxyethylthiazole kinase